MTGLAQAAVERDPDVVRLRTGQAVTIRAVTPADEPALGEFLEGLSLDARRVRFFRSAYEVRATALSAASPDGEDHLALVARDDRQRVVGHAAYVRMYGRRAAVAVEVANHLHHVGLGTCLIDRCSRMAEQWSISHFVAEVAAGHSEIVSVFHDGFAPIQRSEGGAIEVEFPTANWRLAQRRFAAA